MSLDFLEIAALVADFTDVFLVDLIHKGRRSLFLDRIVGVDLRGFDVLVARKLSRTSVSTHNYMHILTQTAYHFFEDKFTRGNLFQTLGKRIDNHNA